MMQDKVIPKVEGVIPPDPVSFWPPQPGWYVVIVILLALLIWGIYKAVKKYQKNAYRRMGLMQLKKLQELKPDQGSLAQLNNLLKAASIEAYSRDVVASLSGPQWYEFLAGSCKRNPFSEDQSTVIANGSFDHSLIDNMDQTSWNKLVISAQNWMKSHRS